MKRYLKEWPFALVALSVLAVMALVHGCSKTETVVPIATAVTIPVAQMPQGLKGDSIYAQVNRDWVLPFHEAWWAEQHKKGAKYDARNDCNKFSAKLVADMQFEYYVRNFHSWSPGQALAVATIYYAPQAEINKVRKGRSGYVAATWEHAAYFVPEGSLVPEWIPYGHAVLEMKTAKGTEYFEPQPVAAGRGKFVILTDDEQRAIYGRSY